MPYGITNTVGRPALSASAEVARDRCHARLDAETEPGLTESRLHDQAMDDNILRTAGWIARRREIAAACDGTFASVPKMMPLRVRFDVGHAYHLDMLQMQLDRLRMDRTRIFAVLRAGNIGGTSGMYQCRGIRTIGDSVMPEGIGQLLKTTTNAS